MARYIGPTTRVSRRFGQPIFGATKAYEKRNYPPGQHGPKSRRKVSEYAVGLNEKQKLRFIYGLLERQFRTYYHKASGQKGNTGENLLRMLESRLDNIVYRMGFAVTRAAARQLVSHAAIRVNGKKVNLPSYQVRPGDEVALSERAKSQLRTQEALTLSQEMDLAPAWLEVDQKKGSGMFKAMPERSDLPSDINESLIIELYSK